MYIKEKKIKSVFNGPIYQPNLKKKKRKKKASESGKSWVNQIYYFFGIDTFFLE